MLQSNTLSDDSLDITQPISNNHGRYVLGLHLVLVHTERWRIANAAFVQTSKEAFLASAKKYGLGISRLSILADHLHAAIRFTYDQSPEQIALSFMNNIAYCHGMLKMWMDSFYVGTIGPYDMNAIRRIVADQSCFPRDELGGERVAREGRVGL